MESRRGPCYYPCPSETVSNKERHLGLVHGDQGKAAFLQILRPDVGALTHGFVIS
jgi:hypothetical protein